MTGEAFAMRIQLARLGQQHNAASRPVTIPLADPVDYPVIIEGYASTADIDLDRTRFRPYVFTVPPLLKELPPPDLEHFAEVVAAAGPLRGPEFERIQREQEEIRRRLAEAKQRIYEYRAAVRRRR